MVIALTNAKLLLKLQPYVSDSDDTVSTMAQWVLFMQVFAGLLVGAMLPYWFSAMTMKSVGKAALAMVEEVRHQFNTIPGEWRRQGGERSRRVPGRWERGWEVVLDHLGTEAIEPTHSPSAPAPSTPSAHLLTCSPAHPSPAHRLPAALCRLPCPPLLLLQA